MGTTWWLSSSESATDVKELIPEFFYFPEFLVNNERKSLVSVGVYWAFLYIIEEFLYIIEGSCILLGVPVYYWGFLYTVRCSLGCNFGVKQNGDIVDNVILPPWAKENPRLFILKHRQVMTCQLCLWDVLFYCVQYCTYQCIYLCICYLSIYLALGSNLSCYLFLCRHWRVSMFLDI